MTIRSSLSGLLLAAVVVVLGSGCEPYMSMTDPMSAEARQAATLLPEHPRFVGMVDVQTVLTRLDRSGRIDLADSLQHSDHDRLQAFFEATELDPREDLHAVYGAVESNESFSAIVMGNLSPEQVQGYIDRATNTAGRAGTYRDAPLFQLALDDDGIDEGADTFALAFLEENLMAVAQETEQVQSIVDRHRDQSPSLADNEEYMQLMRRVGGGTTAWMLGRDVLETALQDTAEAGTTGTVNRAGVQKALIEWSNRVLGLSEMPEVPNVGQEAEDKLERLHQRVREQAVSLTWTERGIDGQVFLTMRDEASASSVMQVAEGAMAVLRLSSDNLTERQRDLLDEVTIERDGALVHVQFSIDQELIDSEMQTASLERVIRRGEASTRRPMASVHRIPGINVPPSALSVSPIMSGGMQPDTG